jgi:hypothetical protein
MAGQGFIDTVVDNFPHQVVQALYTGTTDIHAWALAYRLQTLQNRNLLSRVPAFVCFSH